MQDGRDLQVTPANGQRLADAAPSAILRYIPAVNHVLVDTPAEGSANLATYADPGVPLSTGLTDAIADFVKTSR